MDLRDRLPHLEDAGETAVEWARDGFVSARDAVKDEPLMWSAAAVALGVAIGGLFALWRRGMKLRYSSPRRSLAAHTRGRSAWRTFSTATKNSVKKKSKPSWRARRTTKV